MRPKWPAWLPLREDLQELTPYGAPQLESIAQLNTNENPFPPSKALVDAIAAKASDVAKTLNRYPDRDAIELRKMLAIFINEREGTAFSGENIWPANGSNEVIQSLFLAFGGRTALGFVPSYSMHPLIAQNTSTTWVKADRENDFSINVPLACEQIRSTKPEMVSYDSEQPHRNKHFNCRYHENCADRGRCWRSFSYRRGICRIFTRTFSNNID